MDDRICRLRPIQFGLSLGTFIVVAYLACLLLAVVVPDRGLHQPWLQFFPGFGWSASRILLGVVEGFVYGFASGVVFASIFNAFGAGRAG